MNYRNCSVFDILLILMFLDSSWADRRVKRLSTPSCDDETHELEKYVVSIRSRRPQIIFGDNHFCVGTIIAPKFILTAARCTMSVQKVRHRTRSLVVVGGTPNRLIQVNTTETRRVKRIIVPINYLKRNTNNIALLELYNAWPTDNPSIDIINLPNEAAINTTTFTVLGWGRLFLGGPISGNLLHIKVKLFKALYCKQIVKTLKPEMLCAGNDTESVDEHPCAGDTGGPMIHNRTLYGLVSYRVGCGFTSMPSVYTDVWYHLDWINENLRNSSPCAVQTKLCISIFALITLSICRAT